MHHTKRQESIYHHLCYLCYHCISHGTLAGMRNSSMGPPWWPITPWAHALPQREREMFYLTTHSTHFIYGYMASDIWLRTILIVRKETRCRHIGYSYRLTARVLLYAPSHRQDNTYHGLCYTSRGALAGTRNSSKGPPHEGSIRRPIAPWANALPQSYVSLPPDTFCLCIQIHLKWLLYHSTNYYTIMEYSFPFFMKKIKDVWFKIRNVLFNNTLSTFYLLLYGVEHMDHSDERRPTATNTWASLSN